jgi:SAM-dependent methyltransferase
MRNDLELSYDRIAAAYAAAMSDELDHKPFDRAILNRFAQAVSPLGMACDLGCGPGQVARYLTGGGLPVMGIDLSSEMIAQAKRLGPGIPFRKGSMLALDVRDESFGGIAAFYSIIHVPRDLLDQAFREMWRTLRPEGILLLAFHIGEADRHLDEWFGVSVSVDGYFFDRRDIEKRLIEIGFAIVESGERPPYSDVEVQTTRAYIMARKQASISECNRVGP